MHFKSAPVKSAPVKSTRLKFFPINSVFANIEFERFVVYKLRSISSVKSIKIFVELKTTLLISRLEKSTFCKDVPLYSIPL